MKKNNKGIGLLELMLALAIIAILLVMATRYYMSASLNSRINQAGDALTSLPAAGECWASSPANTGDNAGTYAGLESNLSYIAYTDKCYPTSLVTPTGNQLITPYGNITLEVTATSIKAKLPGSDVTLSTKEIGLLASKICQRGFSVGTGDNPSFTYEAITQTCE